MTEHRYDALVIGAGIGGLCAAARLVDAGYRTLLVERLDRVGGRASTVEIDGFLINTGAAVFELDGMVEEAARLIDAPFDVVAPKRSLTVRLGRTNLPASTFLTGRSNGLSRPFLRAQLTRLPTVARKLGITDEQVTTEQWLSTLTRNRTAHSLMRNVAASMFAANSNEVPAATFLRYFSGPAGLKSFGFAAGGAIGVPRAMAEALQCRGADIWLSSDVSALHIADGRVHGATINRGADTVEVLSDVVVSDVGPKATVELCGRANLPADYVHTIDRVVPCPMLAVYFASQKRLLSLSGLMTFGKTQRLVSLVNFTDTRPEMAPAGWHLYLAWSVPVPALGAFDEQTERDILLSELRSKVPGFDHAKIVATNVLKDEWPAQRALSGFDPPHTTPIANLWNVGDGVKQHGDGGTEGCAKVAKLVVNDITATHRPSPFHPTNTAT